MKKFYKLINSKNSLIVATQVIEAKSFLERLKGLMFDDDMKEFDGLLITSCNSIHTMFMRFAIDVVFLDKNFRVIKIIKKLQPWRVTWFYFSASQVLEMKEGTLISELAEGDQLEVVCLS